MYSKGLIQHKSRVFDEEWKLHLTCYRQLDSVMRRYYHLENGHAQQLSLLIPELDSIGFIFYKPVANKLASYLDTRIYQTKHMLDDFRDLLTNYQLKFNENQTKLTEMIKQFRKRKQQTTDYLQQIHKSITKKAQSITKAVVDNYNYSLQKYRQVNDSLLTYRSQYHQNMIALATDEIIRFFVLELERLRNNQFDIDQILKKTHSEQTMKLIELQQQILWKPIESYDIVTGPNQQRDVTYINDLIKELFKEKLDPSHFIFSIFNEQSFNENMSKIRSQLENPQFQAILRRILMLFRDDAKGINLNQMGFRRVLRFATIIFEHAVENLKVDLLDTLLMFSSAVSMKPCICDEKGMQLFEIITIFDELRRHEYQRQQYWSVVSENLNKNFEGNEREQLMERYRKCLRKLGISMLDQIKPKKKIFGKPSKQQ